MKFDLTIEKDVPLPPFGNFQWEQIIRKMKLGDSFLVATRSAANTAQHAGVRLKRPLTSRKVAGGWRLWRIRK